MPFISQTDRRNASAEIVPAEYRPEASFYDVFSAGVGQVIDEEMSISSLLNNEALNERQRATRELADSGRINIEQYTSNTGEIDYNRIAVDTGLIKTDREVYDQRNDILRRRREYREDVFQRGSGMAQFFGMATGFVLDPVNISTMGLATSASAVRGLSTLAQAMTVARNEAAIAASAELLIQPLVYQHKHDIGSPYSVSDALLAITTASLGAGAIGGIAGGLSGYLRAVREKAAPFVPEQPSVETPLVRDIETPAYSPELQAYEILARIEDDISLNRQNSRYAVIAQEYEQFRKGDTKTIADLNDKTIKELEARKNAIIKGSRNTYGRYIANRGGLNIDAWSAEGFDIPDLKDIKGDFGKPFARRNGGMTPDDLAEMLTELQEEGFPGLRIDRNANKAIEFIDDLRLRGDRLMSEEANSEINAIDYEIDRIMQSQGDEVIESVYGPAVEQDIRSDIEWLEQYEARAAEYQEPLKTPAMYEELARIDAAPQTLGARERDVLARDGLETDYDYDIAEYNQLVDQGTPVVNFDGENIIDAKAVIDDYDSQIEGLNSVLECALG